MKTKTIITVAVTGIFIALAGVALSVNFRPAATPDASQRPDTKSESTDPDGKQVITITARGGYTPKTSAAKAGVPTIIRVVTDNTFDCSSSISIPGIGYRNNLPRTGTTDIEVPAQAAGTRLQGTCSMGMYGFTVDFE